MMNEIFDGMSLAINTEFGDDYEIYTENVEQGLQEPCFSILCLNPTFQQFLGKRYFRTNQFCIHYFPHSTDRVFECHEVIERLFKCMEIIIVGDDKIRGTGMHAEISDGVVSFFVNYDLFTYEQEDKPQMEDIQHETDLKG